MMPALFAFDLDGTLLDSNKRVRPANAAALRAINGAGSAVALASGRLGAGVRRCVPELGLNPALVVLNGAEVFTGSDKDAPRIRYAPLAPQYAEYLTGYCAGKPFTLNFYHEDKLYTAKTCGSAKWAELYHRETGVEYNILDDFSIMKGVSPSKIIFIGEPSRIDEEERFFHEMWGGGEVYVCRSWDYYLEFMNPQANKGLGLTALCEALGIDIADAAAYGDAENDIPMLSAAGYGAAMKNSPEKVKAKALRVTELTNDEDWVAAELEKYNITFKAG